MIAFSHRHARFLAVSMALALLVAACGPAATPVPTSGTGATPTATRVTVAPTATAVPPRSTSTPTPTPSPTAAPKGPKMGGTARLSQRADPPTWDPAGSHDEQINAIKYLVFTKFFTLWSDEPGQCQRKPYPMGVKSWRWLDDTTAEFVLREGMKYHNKAPANGREVVAADAPAALVRFWTLDAFWAGRGAMVDSVTAKDKYTFTMKLKSPWPGLVTEMMAAQGGAWLEAAEVAGPKGVLWTQPEKSWVGSGPFLFDTWQPAVKTRLVRRPDYWGRGRPYLDAVESPIIPDASTRMAALLAGKLTLIRDLSEEFIEVAERTSPGTVTVRCPGMRQADVGMLWLNTTGPPLGDVRVRRAVAMAIDQKAIIDKLYKGKANYSAILPPITPYAMPLEDFPLGVRQYLEYHPDRSKQLLAEAGYPNGFDTAINFTGRYAAPSPR